MRAEMADVDEPWLCLVTDPLDRPVGDERTDAVCLGPFVFGGEQYVRTGTDVVAEGR